MAYKRYRYITRTTNVPAGLNTGTMISATNIWSNNQQSLIEKEKEKKKNRQGRGGKAVISMHKFSSA